MPDDAKDLVALAKKLRLTQKQRRFAEALARDPHQRAEAAALAVGCGKGAAVTAWKWLHMAKVLEYKAAVVAAAEARGLKMLHAGELEAELAIMEETELLSRLSMLARADIGRHLEVGDDGDAKLKINRAHTGIIREYVEEQERTTKHGEETVTVQARRLKVADPLPALVGLARIKGLEQGAGGGTTLTGLVLVQLLVQAGASGPALAGVAKLLSGAVAGGNGNGNGHHP